MLKKSHLHLLNEGSLEYLWSWIILSINWRQYSKRLFVSFRFATKESAAHAIVATHNTEVAGHTVKCSWGKESGDPNNIHTNAQVAMQVGDMAAKVWC